MHFASQMVFKSYFTIICCIALAFMISYWIYKYGVEDRDIGTVDYIALEDLKDFDIPVVSLCFVKPFVDRKIISGNSPFNSTKYLQYLSGDIWNESFYRMDYQNISVDLDDYFFTSNHFYERTTHQNISSKMRIKEIFKIVTH